MFLYAPRQLGGLAHVAARRHGQQAVLLGLRDLQRLDQAVQRLGRHGLAARDFLELFIRALHAKAAHHRLDGLGQHFPRGVQVVGQGFLVYALGQVPPLVVGLALLTQPAVSAAIGWVAYGEAMTSRDFLGAFAIGAALVLVRLQGGASGPKSVAA